MKKLVRWFFIWGTVCCLLGVGAVTAGVMMGGLSEIGAYVKQSPLYSHMEYGQEYVEEYEQEYEQDHQTMDHQTMNPEGSHEYGHE